MTMPPLRRAAWRNTCGACGKLAYTSRKLAKQAARDVDPGGHGSVYRCGDIWHWGHLAPVIIRGYANRSRP